MPALILLLIALGGVAAVAAARREPTLKGKRAQPIPTIEGIAVDIVPEPLPARAAKTETPPGLRTWGDAPADTDASFQPGYAKSLGTQDFRWGVCLPDLIDELQKHPGAPAWTKDLDELIVKLANIIAAGAGTIAKWITDRACLRFKWPLRRFEFENFTFGDNPKLWSVQRREENLYAPPVPLPPREGWDRVWVRRESGGFAGRTRNVTAVQVYWPDAKVWHELVSTDQLRGMLRMDIVVSGAITAKQLAGAARGKSKFWFATRSKAMKEFK